jgi:hypothetical protein
MAIHNWNEFDKRAREELKPSKKIDQIIIAEGRYFNNFLPNLEERLKAKGVTYEIRKNPSSAQWLCVINGVHCRLKSDRRQRLAYLEGWVPAYESLAKSGVYMTKGLWTNNISRDQLTTMKNQELKKLKSLFTS